MEHVNSLGLYGNSHMIFDSTLAKGRCVLSLQFYNEFAHSCKAIHNLGQSVKRLDLKDGGQTAYCHLDQSHRSTADHNSSTHMDLYLSKRNKSNAVIHPHIAVISPNTGIELEFSEPYERFVTTKRG